MICGTVRVISGKLCQLIYEKNSQKCFITDRTGQIHIYNAIPTPPIKLKSIQTDSIGALRGLDFDSKTNNVFANCIDDGRIYGYNLGTSIKNDINP